MRTKIRLLTLLVLMFAGTTLFAQDKAISGVVKDNTGAELSGATVSVKGTSNSVMTDAKGKFTIKANAKATLVVSFVGFESKEAVVGGQTTVNFSLAPGTSALNDVVVTSLGISKKQKALGYATSTISAEQITDAGTPNFATALYGKAPGVRIAATPGGATSAVNINIRGINSITGKNDPLIILDGIPIRNGEVRNDNYWGDQRLRGNGLLDLQTEDIENISILKGASAAALYGSEAVNGVVLVTTKQASKNRKGLGVDVSTNYSIDKIAYLPRYQNVRGYGISNVINNGGQDDAGFIYHDLNGDGIKETRSLLNFSINYGPKFDGQPILTWDNRIIPYSAQPDNYAGLFQTATNSSINVAVSKATDNASIRFSLTRQANEGISMNSGSEKNTMNLNTSFRLSPKFSTDVMVNYINQTINNRPYSIDRMINNFTGMIGRFDNGEWYMNKAVTSKGYRYRTGTQQSATPAENIFTAGGGFKNDIADYAYRVKMHQLLEVSNRVIASMTNNYSILPDLKLRTRIATDFTSAKDETRQPNEVPLAFGNSGYFGLGQTQNTTLYGDALLTYTKKINNDLEVSALGGYTATDESMLRITRGTSGGLSTENLYDIAASMNVPGQGSSRMSITKDAFIGTFNANYKDYWFLEATVRRDRTSTMNPNNNSFAYPSVNTSYIFSDALKMPSWLSYGKVRGSWGIVGNFPDPYLANVAYGQNTLGSQGGNPVLFTSIPSNFGNDAIRPEQKKEFEFGIETRLFNNRVTFEASYYNAQIVDQILPLSLPATSGATSILANVGTLRNTGLEVTISGFPIKKANFSWETGINLAQNQNKVEQLAPGLTELLHADYDGNAAQLKSVVGQPMGDFYAHPVLTNAKGEQIVRPDGIYAVDPNTMYKVGNAMPKLIGGWFNTVKYKNFSLDAMIDFRYGGYVMPTGINWMISRGLLEESLQFMDKESGGLSYYKDKTSGKYTQTNAAAGPQGEKVFHDGMLLPGVKADGSKNDNIVPQSYYFWNTYNWGGPQYSASRYDLYIVENSYVKMREITIGYNMPSKVASMIGAKKLQFSVFGRNLFYIYRTLKHLDAEQTTAGSRWAQNLTNAGGNPSTRSFGVMLRASF